MKKLLFIASMLFMSMSSMQAQVAYEKAKLTDNVYLGIEGGATTNFNFDPVFPLNAAAGVKLGKNFSPIFGVNLESLFSFGDNNYAKSHTFVKFVNLGLNTTVNLTNLFLGYNPDKTFELSTEIGAGYAMYFGDPVLLSYSNLGDDTELTAKTGLTFAWNLGEKKAWQFYVEPAILWNITNGPGDAIHFNRKHAQIGLFAGLNYKFLTSNGTHNFKVWNVGEMNDQINDLRA